jgi:Na+-transporting NADH:ubiquinone oxidoreductase subunit B/electron transport complex protein RnfD
MIVKRIESLFAAMKGARILRPVRPIIETFEGIVIGVDQSTPGAPHLRDHIEIKRYMSVVILALMPSTISAIYFFGLHAVLMIVTSYAVGGLIEVLFALIRKKEIEEGFLVTGLIFPLILPPTTPLWVVAVGIGVGTFFGKEVFGGTGKNIFNVALVGRLFITIAFPGIMSAQWMIPFTDAITSATPLSVYRGTQVAAPYMDLLLGRVAGSIGELFRLGVIAGGIFLTFTKVSSWRISLTYLATVFVLAAVGNWLAPDVVAPPVFQLLAGSVLFGAFYMATDPVTSPATKSGKVAFGVGCGLVTIVIRTFSGFTEGVMFSIVFMNAFAPLIDTIVLNLKYKPVEI